MRRRTARHAIVTAVFAVVALAGCSSSSNQSSPPQPSVSAPPPTTTTVTARPSGNPALDAEFPPTIAATRMGHDYVHLPVPSADLTELINIHGGLLAALVERGAFAGEVYPVMSDNDGASWTIDGPQFANAGTCSLCATSKLLVSHDHALLAWGPGGGYVKTTTDRGTHWWQARFAHGVVDVEASGRRLIARAVGAETPAGTYQTRLYTSTDDGRHWTRGAAAGNVSHVR